MSNDRLHQAQGKSHRREKTASVLDNVVWHTLNGPHAAYSTGTSAARRYAPGFSPIIGFADTERPDLAALAPYCEPGEHFYCSGWTGTAPSGWRIDVDTSAHQMVWDGAMPAADDALGAVPLRSEHAPQMQALVAVAPPGPFGPRTRELGEYFGVFEAGRLVAMAGERMGAGAFREISGVCTHPDFQGRGLAGRLVRKLIRIEMQRRETPFLHVMADNAQARGLYERLGFRHHQEVIVRVISRAASGP